MSRPNFWAGKSCIVSGCDGTVDCRGLCKKHYSRAQRSGSLERRKRPSFAEVARSARADAAITLVSAGLLPKSTNPETVASLLGLSAADLKLALSKRTGRRRDALPRANVDRASAPKGKKWCHKCRRFLLFELFHNDRNSVDGRCNMCKTCKRKYQKAYRSKRARSGRV